MNWRNVRLIYQREIRDQLRDRRTLFMIAVLPLLLYPLLGMSVFQLAQFLRTSVPRVLVIGSEQLADADGLTPLFEEDRFVKSLFDDSSEAERFILTFVDSAGSDDVSRPLQAGETEVVLHFPADFGQRLRELRNAVQASALDEDRGGEDRAPLPTLDSVPQPELFYNSAREKSRIAHGQVEQILDRWKSQIVRENLLASRVPTNIARPFELQPRDVAERQEQQARLWSKILPFVLFIWALTGAFYPAVDLCAGEKERGTLETLLSSPALRSEIVWGKLLTVMTFSMATALLNLVSLGITAQYILSQFRELPALDLTAGMDMPPLSAMLWLLVGLLPMSALFSALCLASAAFARSTKEGQYYLMPLLLVTLPLMMLPMAPGAELDLGNSLIPVTGVVLLLKGLVQGNYAEVLPYVLPVGLVTLLGCHLAIRWAVYQFNQETVLFRESERLDLRRWFVHLVRDRQQVPSLAQAFFCVAVIYVIQFFVGLAISAHAPESPDFSYLVQLLFISLVVCIALPALSMTLLLTGRPLKTLLLDRPPRVSACLAAVLLAVLVHPLGMQLMYWIRQLYPLQEQALTDVEAFGRLIESAPNRWLPYLLMAILPAVCEELAYRGFILSGLRHLGRKWWAIGLSALFFGFAHATVQQSIMAVAVGLVIGYVAVQSGSLIPCILFHFTYNATLFSVMEWSQHDPGQSVLAELIRQPTPDQVVYVWPVLMVCAGLSLVLLAWFGRLPYQATKEEQLSDARAHQGRQLPARVKG